MKRNIKYIFAASLVFMFSSLTAQETAYPGIDYDVPEADFGDNSRYYVAEADIKDWDLKERSSIKNVDDPLAYESDLDWDSAQGTDKNTKKEERIVSNRDENIDTSKKKTKKKSLENYGIGKRFFEFRMEVPAGVSNNVFTIGDILKEDLVIDLPAVADSVPRNGMKLDILTNPNFGWNVNARSFGFGIKAGSEIQANVTLGKDIFQFIGYGNKSGEAIKSTINATADVMLSYQIPIYFKVSNLKINVTPTYFVPIVHTSAPDMNVSLLNTADGKFKVDISGTTSIYTGLSASLLQVYLSKGESDDVALSIDDVVAMMSNGGFDLSLGGTYPLFSFLDVRVNTQIPIVPGKLISSVVMPVNYGFETTIQDAFLGNFTFPTFDMPELTVHDSNYSIRRPLRLGVGANFRPFGYLFDISGDLGMAVKYPFSHEAKFFMEYGLGAQINLINMLVVSLNSQYKNQLFTNSASVVLNIRALELNVKISTQSANFISSFGATGINVSAGFAIGF